MTKPQPGRVVVVHAIPECDFCGAPGPYDFKTTFGPWAHGCEACWRENAARPGVLALGVAQRWILADQVSEAVHP